jgi:phosphoglucomutase
MHERAGTLATASDLINVDALLDAYSRVKPDPNAAEQLVVFGTSGHRGSSLRGSFNEDHIAAVTQAIVEYRLSLGNTGPMFIGADTHALSEPALNTVLDVLGAHPVKVLISAESEFVPTPSLSRAIVMHNRERTKDFADGILLTPSHNPPADGGIKYNAAHGGPADTDATSWIAARANELLRAGADQIARGSRGNVGRYDFLENYVDDLAQVIDMEAIRDAKVRIGAHPLGGASVAYWSAIRDRYDLNLSVLGNGVDPTWAFMSLDWDGQIRMDPSSEFAMAAVTAKATEFDVVTANDADADRHGIVTPDGGLMNPNHFLAVAIDYLITHRPDWPTSGAIGKTLVSSSLIDEVVSRAGRELFEVPVGFKWFVDGLRSGELLFGGEESAGASFLQRDGSTWTTDKDGILLALLAAEIIAKTGQTPSQRYRALTEQFGSSAYERRDAPASAAQKAALAALNTESILQTELAGEPIVAIRTAAPGNGAPIGGIKVETEHSWFAARPSGTEDVYKIYAESFLGVEHLSQVQREAQAIVDAATS